MMFEKIFEQTGEFEAWRAAQQWLEENGYSYGSTCAGWAFVGVLKGDYVIAKWRNLTKKEIQELDGVARGDFRDGPVTIRLKLAPEESDK